jgi:multidrug transporter EmrE-like cation transporter
MSWEVAGLPLHILVIHAAVVFGPLAALCAIAYVVVPRYRDLLRWPTLVLTVIAVGAIWAAYLTGQNFFASERFATFSGEALENIETHQGYAQTLRWIASGFGIVTLATTYFFHDRTSTTRTVLGALVVISAVATLVWVGLTGDAGSRAVWS